MRAVSSGLHRLAALLVVSLTACGGGSDSGSGGDSPPPQPPTGLQVYWTEFDKFAVTWKRSTSSVDRYVAEARVESGPWELISIRFLPTPSARE